MNLLCEHEANYISSKFSSKVVECEMVKIGSNNYFFNPDPRGQFNNIRCYNIDEINPLIEPDTETEYKFTETEYEFVV